MNRIHYSKGYKYQLTKDYHTSTRIRPQKAIDTRYIELHPDGKLTIRAGYAWDGAGGPTLDTKTCRRGACGHDAKYQLIRMGLIQYSSAKEIADDELYEDLIEDGMWKWRASVWRTSVSIFGRNSLSPSDERPVLIAP